MKLPIGTSQYVTNVETRYWVEDETNSEMGAYASKQAIERAQFRKELEDKIKRAPKKESFAKTTSSGGSLTGKIARLQKLYKNGTLTKAEFEKAKNNLLK